MLGDLPSRRDLSGGEHDWILTPEHAGQLFHALDRPEVIGRAGAESDLDVGFVGHGAGLIGGVITAGWGEDLDSRISGALDAAGNAAGLGADVAGLLSRAPAPAAAARLATTGALLSFAANWWDVFSGGGAAIQEGVDDQEREGHRAGLLDGFGAGLLGNTLPEAQRKLHLAPPSPDGLALESGFRAQLANYHAYDDAIAQGWALAHALPLTTKLSIVYAIDHYAADRHILVPPERDTMLAAIRLIRESLPPLTGELHTGTWQIPEDTLTWVLTHAPALTHDVGASGDTATIHAGDDLWQTATDTLTQAWGRSPTSAEILDYWQQIITLNSALLLPPEAPGLFPDGQGIDLPAIPLDPNGISTLPDDGVPDTSVPQPSAGEVDWDGDGVPDISVLLPDGGGMGPGQPPGPDGTDWLLPDGGGMGPGQPPGPDGMDFTVVNDDVPPGIVSPW